MVRVHEFFPFLIVFRNIRQLLIIYNGTQQLKGMRNIIIHQYEKINDRIVFFALKDKVPKDIEEFLTLAEQPPQPKQPSP